jgi:aryl-alcohol dehydrogenase-like predicted oxidoreductase
MQYRELGRSGIEVSSLAFGAWQIADPEYWGADADVDAQRTVSVALDAGITLFDTAEAYGKGESERLLGACLGARRPEAVVASKIAPWNCAPDKVAPACEASLARLGTDYLDLYQVHWPFERTAFDDVHAALDTLRDQGKVRAVGVSNYGTRDLAGWMRTGTTVSNQLAYSLLFRAIEYEIVPACQDAGVGILAYMPLMQGLLAGRWAAVDDVPVKRRRTRQFSSEREGTGHDEPGCEQETFAALAEIQALARELDVSMAVLALAWTMQQPGISSVIVGARKPHQLERNLDAATRDLSPAVVEQLNAITEPVKAALGANADLWKSGEDSRVQ